MTSNKVSKNVKQIDYNDCTCDSSINRADGELNGPLVSTQVDYHSTHILTTHIVTAVTSTAD